MKKKINYFDSRTTEERQSEPEGTTTTSEDKPVNKEVKKYTKEILKKFSKHFADSSF